jgi:hypothetical protein
MATAEWERVLKRTEDDFEKLQARDAELNETAVVSDIEKVLQKPIGTGFSFKGFMNTNTNKDYDSMLGNDEDVEEPRPKPSTRPSSATSRPNSAMKRHSIGPSCVLGQKKSSSPSTPPKPVTPTKSDDYSRYYAQDPPTPSNGPQLINNPMNDFPNTPNDAPEAADR